MNINIGDTYTTTKSKVTGVVEEIFEKSFGTVLRLSLPNGDTRYTTV